MLLASSVELRYHETSLIITASLGSIQRYRQPFGGQKHNSVMVVHRSGFAEGSGKFVDLEAITSYPEKPSSRKLHDKCQ